MRDFNGVLVPENWTDNSAFIFTSKYLRKAGVPSETVPVPEEGIPAEFYRNEPTEGASFGSETNALSVFKRLAGHWVYWAFKYGYYTFKYGHYTQSEAQKGKKLYQELIDDMYHQRALPNSPQLFNTGLYWAYGITGTSTGTWHCDPQTGKASLCENLYEYPQTSACFIQSVNDDLVNEGGIMDLWTREARLFKGGSGSGANYSNIRGKGESLSGGGTSSGLISFLRIGDSAAAAIKSGGTTRRAARNVILDADHPDIVELIDWKIGEERKVHALVKGGGGEFDYNWEGEAYRTVQGQTANNNINLGARDILENREIRLTQRTTGDVVGTVMAEDLLWKIAEANHGAGDPGLYFGDTINDWHTVPHLGRIRGTNPCSEFLSIDDTACNLASLNLIKFFSQGFREGKGNFTKAVQRWTFVLELTVSGSSFPSKKIAENTWALRNLGLGYANLGGLLMNMGLGYGSEAGQKLAARITSLMTATAYTMSAQLAKLLGTYAGYDADNHHRIIQKHMEYATDKGPWEEAFSLGKRYGYRNAQVTLLAPTGTSGLSMGCDATGIEPVFTLSYEKTLAGEDKMIVVVADCVYGGLQALGVDIDRHRKAIEASGDVDRTDVSVDLSAFDTAIGAHPLSTDAHIGMMAAVQPFLSGAISKTVNAPKDSTVEDIREIFVLAARSGIKCITVYRDGCKASQPLTTGAEEEPPASALVRRSVPRPALSRTHKLTVKGHTFFMIPSRYEDGGLSEVFIDHTKDGGVLGSILNALAIQISVSLQYGIPLEVITKTMLGTKSDLGGFVSGHPRIRFCTSIPDLIARLLLDESKDERVSPTPKKIVASAPPAAIPEQPEGAPRGYLPDPCSFCGAFRLRRNGTCLVCSDCGETTGCS